MLDADILYEMLDYNEDTGIFTRRIRRGRYPAGSIAGCTDRRGYRVINIDHRNYMAGRLAHLYMTGDWPEHEIDHIDGNPSNDAWSNLRPATRVQVLAKARPQYTNQTGLKGVTPHGSGFNARLRVNGKQTYLGTFSTAEQASNAYQTAAIAAYGTFARVN